MNNCVQSRKYNYKTISRDNLGVIAFREFDLRTFSYESSFLAKRLDLTSRKAHAQPAGVLQLRLLLIHGRTI